VLAFVNSQELTRHEPDICWLARLGQQPDQSPLCDRHGQFAPDPRDEVLGYALDWAFPPRLLGDVGVCVIVLAGQNDVVLRGVSDDRKFRGSFDLVRLRQERDRVDVHPGPWIRFRTARA
jgi:hypothetical protein